MAPLRVVSVSSSDVQLILAQFLCCCTLVSGRKYVVPPVQLENSTYPEWAHHHWVWLSSDRASQKSMLDYASDYMNYGVQVGAVDIDSEWATGFNNFIFNTKKYPDPAEMINTFHANSIKVILWATSMIDSNSTNFEEALKAGYLVRNALGKPAMVKWWHGTGGFLDYTNPDAVTWWHSQMDKVLELGIDGWKCDGTDPFILEVPYARGYNNKLVTRKEYSDAYYGDFFDYSRMKYGKDKLIMSRPVDGYPPFYLDFSPRHVMLSGWVGDADPDFHGLENTLKFYLQSAWAGYANFGSDIGGYRSGDSPLGRTKEVFIRWAQLGAFSPLMENGGNKEHRPWMFDNTNETLNIYKKFVNVHYQLIPYFLTIGSRALENHGSAMKPLAPHHNFINKLIDDFHPSTYNYLLGDSILVAPLYSEGSINTSVSVALPDNQTWVYWWNHSMLFTGKADISSVPLEEYPVFFLKESFIPLRNTKQVSLLPTDEVSRFYLSLDLPSHHSDSLRWLLHMPSCDPTCLGENHSVRREVIEESGSGIVATYWWESCDHFVITISAHPTIHSLIHLAGLERPPQLIYSNLAEKLSMVEESTLALSLKKLGRRNTGGYVLVREAWLAHVLIDPSRLFSELGHKIHVYF